jgi:hypothetical protein
MPAPLIGLAVGAAARLAAKKAAQEAAKKAAKKTATKAAKKIKTSIKVSPNVRVIPGKMSPTSVRASFVNEKFTSGANKARSQNAATKSSSTERANKRALKAANKPTNKTGSAMNKLERKYFQGKNEMIKSMQNTERAGLSKSSRKTTKKK